MLSLAKLAGADQRYYLDQAQARTDHAGSVSSGAEDHYLSGPEAAGQWTGSAAPTQQPDSDDFARSCGSPTRAAAQAAEASGDALIAAVILAFDAEPVEETPPGALVIRLDLTGETEEP